MSVFEFAGHTLDLEQGRLRGAAGDITLRPKALSLLIYLVRHAGRVIGKDELLQALWPNTFVTEESLSQCLKDVRRALGPDAEGLIRTIPRRGYVLDETRVCVSTLREVPSPVPSERPSIAVLPFESTNPDQDWFVDGIAEDITIALARSRKLRVISKSYSFAFKGRAFHGREIAQQLRVRYLLEGSVRLEGRRVRVSARLVEGEAGDLLWAERWDRDAGDIFAIQDEVTAAVVRYLELELLPEERRVIERTRTTNVEAYHFELRGRQLSLALTKSGLILARRMFGKAIELDGGYARAFAGIVICNCYLREWHGEGGAAGAFLQMAEKAVDLDPALPEAHTARGFALFCNARYDDAEIAYRQALFLDPNSYSANFFFASTLMRFRNDRPRMVSLFTLAARLQPDDYISPMMIAAFLPWGDPKRMDWARICVERAERAARLNSEDASPLHRGAVALAYLGEREAAYSWLARALAIEPEEFVAHVNASAIHAQFGDADKAIASLEKAALKAPRKTIDILETDSDFDPIRTDPRFVRFFRLRRG